MDNTLRMLFRVLFLYILIGRLFEGLCRKGSGECEKGLKPAKPGSAQGKAALHVCEGIDFNVTINSTGSEVEEAERVTLTCVHALPEHLNVTYEWYKDNKRVEGQERDYTIEKAFFEHVGKYVCVVLSQCGNYTSPPHDVTVHNRAVIILVICGVSALVLVIIMGLSMKIKMHRDKVKNQQRTKERLQEMRRAQDLQNRGLPPNPTPT